MLWLNLHRLSPVSIAASAAPLSEPSTVSPMAQISDGRKSFVYQPGPWRPMRYEGQYLNGRREGFWRVTDAQTGAPLLATT